MHFKTADLCDQFEQEIGRTLRIVTPMFQSYGAIPRFFGPITTLKSFEDNAQVREILSSPGAGGVLVVDGGGSLRRAMLGDQLALLGEQNGWAGIVIYGAIRDSVEVNQTRIGVRALGTHPQKTAKRGVGERDVPVSFGGVTFYPGEWLYADEDGILVAAQALPLA